MYCLVHLNVFTLQCFKDSSFDDAAVTVFGIKSPLLLACGVCVVDRGILLVAAINRLSQFKNLKHKVDLLLHH